MTDDMLGLPDLCGVAFKEWAGICEALADGRQSLVLRKGGIAEGPHGFLPEHHAFWLYPTHVHEGEQGLRVAAHGVGPRPQPADSVALRAVVTTGPIAFVDRPETLAGLEEFHVWTRETVAKRFAYRRPGLWVLGVRVSVCDPPHVLPATPEHAGCKTWVPLDPPVPTAGAVPVLDDAEFARRMDRLRALLATNP